MDENNAIEVNGISKKFKLEVETSEKKKSLINRTPTKTIDHVVLDNISFKVKKGEILGILGRNGSGKSTLLYILGKIMAPDSGSIEYSGKLASVLELGMGFHADLSGRENIYLKGELYGFSKKEIDQRMSSIIEYSGLGQFIDNPVRTYSSGMSGRLAFSIMVNVESDIMLVDEVLSVGDSAFSIKAQQHFKKIAKTGKTIIIVSHSMQLIEELCTRAIWIENGHIIKDGPAKLICAEYQNSINESPEIILDLATNGVPEAQYKLALMYRDGNNYEQNDELYKEWIEKAALHGHTKAQVLLADLLISENKTEDAIELYRLAADKGDSDAKNKISMLKKDKKDTTIELINETLTMINENTSGINEFRLAEMQLKIAWNNKDKKNAYDLFERALMDGYIPAAHQMAIMHRDGIGIERNIAKMEELLSVSAEKGFMPSITMLSDLYYQGRLLPKNDDKCFNWTLKASELGNAGMMYKLAVMYRDGIGTDKNEKASNYWINNYNNICLQQQRQYAQNYLKIHSPEDYSKMFDKIENIFNTGIIHDYYVYQIINGKETVEILTQMKKLANAGNIDAQRRLGNYYYDGVGVKKDYGEAVKWYEKAAQLGDSWSQNRLGEIYRDGKTGKIDAEKSKFYFISAAEQGNTGSIGNLISMIVTKELEDNGLHEQLMGYLYGLANAGNIDAQRRLGNYYYDGVGVKKDYGEAVKWYEKAAQLGDSWSKHRLSDIYREGNRIKPNAEQSMKWFV